MNNPFIDVFCPHCGEFVNPIYEGDCPNCGEYIGSDDNEEWDDGSDGDGYYFIPEQKNSRSRQICCFFCVYEREKHTSIRIFQRSSCNTRQKTR